MKKDNKLIKKILLFVEAQEKEVYSKDLIFTGHSDLEVMYNLKQAIEMGCFDIINTSSFDGDSFVIKKLTPMGHYFLDEVRKTWWSKVVASVLRESGKIIWTALGAVLAAAAIKFFGLAC